MRQRDQAAGEERAADRQHGRDRRDQHPGNGEPHRPRDGLDVVRRARHQVAGSRALHRGERQPHHARHEALAQLGEDRSPSTIADRLASHVRTVSVSRNAASARTMRSTVPRLVPAADLVDESADAGTGQPDRPVPRARTARRCPRGRAGGGSGSSIAWARTARAGSDRQPVAGRARARGGHASSPRVTVSSVGGADVVVAAQQLVVACRTSATDAVRTEEHDGVGPVEQQRAGTHDDGRAAGAGRASAGRRSRPRCARRPRWSARPAAASRRR